jgi:hypothetical protein
MLDRRPVQRRARPLLRIPAAPLRRVFYSRFRSWSGGERRVRLWARSQRDVSRKPVADAPLSRRCRRPLRDSELATARMRKVVATLGFEG